MGNAPIVGYGVFFYDSSATVYYIAGTTGWGATFGDPGGLPTMLWSPQVACGYTITNGTVTITKYLGSGGTVVIPSTINGLPVTSIGYQAFASSSLTSVTIPNCVTNIGGWAFCDCTNLTSVTIPNSVTTIGEEAFASSSLASITLGSSVTSIGGGAFISSSLTSITIPSSVTNIGDYAFEGCYSLRGVYFHGNAPAANSSVFYYDNPTIYYLPGTTNWGSAFAGRPTVLWNPQVQTSGATFGVRTNKFGFNITGSSGLVIIVEARTNLANPIWSPVGTNTLTGGWSYFSDAEWTNYPARLYRLRSP